MQLISRKWLLQNQTYRSSFHIPGWISSKGENPVIPYFLICLLESLLLLQYCRGSILEHNNSVVVSCRIFNIRVFKAILPISIGNNCFDNTFALFLFLIFASSIHEKFSSSRFLGKVVHFKQVQKRINFSFIVITMKRLCKTKICLFCLYFLRLFLFVRFCFSTNRNVNKTTLFIFR